MPRTFQGRLTVAFVAVIALTLLLVAILVLNRLDDYFTKQQIADFHLRSQTVAKYVQIASQATVGLTNPVVHPDGVLDSRVVAALDDRADPALHRRRPGPGRRRAWCSA